MKPLLVILAGHAPDRLRARLGDFDDWFRLGLGLPRGATCAVDVTAGQTIPPMNDMSGAVISGSAAMVTERLPWSEQLAGWIRTAMDRQLPLFGVCYGHQLMAHALGGEAGDMPEGRAMGTRVIEILGGCHADPLLSGLPSRFRAHVTHQQGVLALPAGAQRLACSAHDPNHILRYAPNAVSTQLHPEFSVAIMRAYIRLRADALRAEGNDVRTLLRSTAAAPYARRLLRRFAHQCRLADNSRASA